MLVKNGTELISKTRQLLSILPKRPVEFYDRVSTVVDVLSEGALKQPPTYPVREWHDLVGELARALASDVLSFLHESPSVEVEAEIQNGVRELATGAPFSLLHNSDLLLARLHYVVCRAVKPLIVVETGVGYGISSAFILKALHVNGRGFLHSVDLPPLGPNADIFVGHLIPNSLRSRWKLHRGTVKRVLPKLLSDIGKIDVFIHDSLHTYNNMRMEFTKAWSALRAGGVLIADDIEGNRAFLEVMQLGDSFAMVTKEAYKDSLLGVAVKRDKL